MAKHWDTESRWPTRVLERKPPEPTRRHVLPAPEDWMVDAACRGRQPLWDAQLPGETRTQRDARQSEAAKICREACRVLAECREWADRAETVGPFGVVAGRTARASKGKQSGRWVEVA